MMIILTLIFVNWVIFTFKDDFTKSNRVKTTMTEGEMLMKKGKYGFFYSCAIRVDKQVECVGWNNFGQLGNNSFYDDIYFKIVEVENVKNVSRLSVGWFHSCAVHEQKVSCWGLDIFGQSSNTGSSLSSLPNVVFRDLNTNDKFKIETGLLYSCVSSNGITSCRGFILFRQIYMAIRDLLDGVYELVSYVYNQVYDVVYNTLKTIYRHVKGTITEFFFIPFFVVLALFNSDPYFYAPFVLVLSIVGCAVKILFMYRKGDTDSIGNQTPA